MSAARGVYGCGFVTGDTVRVKRGRKLWKVASTDGVGVCSARVFCDLLDKRGRKGFRRVDELILVRKARG